MPTCYVVGGMQEGRRCIFVTLQDKQFYVLFSFEFHCFFDVLFLPEKKYVEIRPALYQKYVILPLL